MRQIHVLRYSEGQQAGIHGVDVADDCWMVITRNAPVLGNVRIDCLGYFALDRTEHPELKPWHQIRRVSSGGA